MTILIAFIEPQSPNIAVLYDLLTRSGTKVFGHPSMCVWCNESGITYMYCDILLALLWQMA